MKEETRTTRAEKFYMDQIFPDHDSKTSLAAMGRRFRDGGLEYIDEREMQENQGRLLTRLVDMVGEIYAVLNIYELRKDKDGAARRQALAHKLALEAIKREDEEKAKKLKRKKKRLETP